LNTLAEYREIHGHCNVPDKYSENKRTGNTKLYQWVMAQRTQCRLYQGGKTSTLTLFRVEELESLTFEWKPSRCRGKEIQEKLSLDNGASRIRERAVVASEHVETTARTQDTFSAGESCSNQEAVAVESEESDSNGEDELACIPGQTAEI
jgi:hypothetical protein